MNTWPFKEGSKCKEMCWVEEIGKAFQETNQKWHAQWGWRMHVIWPVGSGIEERQEDRGSRVSL
jgi:hypothetical protein